MQSNTNEKIPIKVNNLNSRKGNNKKNHVYFVSNYSNSNQKNIKNSEKQMDKNISYNKIQHEKKIELDHPQPLITEFDDDLDELKNVLTQKEKKDIIHTYNSNKKNKKDKDNLERTKDSSEGQNSIHEDKIIKSEHVQKNNFIIKKNNNSESNLIKVINNKKNIYDKNTCKIRNKININPFIYSNCKGNNYIYVTYSKNTFDKKIYNAIVNSKLKKIHKENQSNNKSIGNENIDYFNTNFNSIKRNKNPKNSKLCSSTTSLNNTVKNNDIDPKRRLIYDECVKNNSIDKSINFSQNNPKNNLKFQKEFNCTKISYKKLNLDLNDKSQNIITNNTQIKTNKEKNKNKNIILPTFNNTKITYVILSKNKKFKAIPKHKFSLENINNIHRNVSLTELKNNPKVPNSGQFSHRKEEKPIVNKNIKIRNYKSQNILSFFNKNRNENNYNNYIKCSITENNKETSENNKIKNCFFSNNKSFINKKNMLHNYDYNYDYGYYYGNNNFNSNLIPFGFNSSYSGNYNY